MLNARAENLLLPTDIQPHNTNILSPSHGMLNAGAENLPLPTNIQPHRKSNSVQSCEIQTAEMNCLRQNSVKVLFPLPHIYMTGKPMFHADKHFINGVRVLCTANHRNRCDKSMPQGHLHPFPQWTNSVAAGSFTPLPLMDQFCCRWVIYTPSLNSPILLQIPKQLAVGTHFGDKETRWFAT